MLIAWSAKVLPIEEDANGKGMPIGLTIVYQHEMSARDLRGATNLTIEHRVVFFLLFFLLRKLKEENKGKLRLRKPGPFITTKPQKGNKASLTLFIKASA